MTARAEAGRPSERVSHLRQGLYLFNARGVQFGEKLYTPQDIQANRDARPGVRRHGTNNFARIGDDDATLVLDLLAESASMMVFGNPSDQPTFKAEVGRFPYRYDGQPGYEAYSIRLVPLSGAVDQVIVTGAQRIDNREDSVEAVKFDVGNTVHVEVYLDKPEEELSPLMPHKGFREDVQAPSFGDKFL